MLRTRLIVIVLCLMATAANASERFFRRQRPVPNRYIVDVADKDRGVIHSLAKTLPQKHSGRLIDVFDHVLGGFVVEMTESEAIRLSRHPGIAGVHEIAIGEPIASEPADGTAGPVPAHALLHGVADATCAPSLPGRIRTRRKRRRRHTR